jgi:Ca2+-binding RTX toxin-like protein
VKLLGGFAGTESSLAERNLSKNAPSVLSGVFGDPGDTSDNAYNVLFSSASLTDTATRVDGFVITGGNANQAADSGNNEGGGMDLAEADLTLANLHFTANVAMIGGGLHVADGSPTLDNVTFSDNTALIRGGGAEISTAGLLKDVTFSGNEATAAINFIDSGLGGGLMADSENNEDLVMKNVTFSGNTAAGDGDGDFGGGFFVSNDANVVVHNFIVFGNTPNGFQREAGVTAGVALFHGLMQGVTCATVSSPVVCDGVEDGNPQLEALASNGGAVPTHGIPPDSVAVDFGDNANCAGPDPRGVDRPVDGDGTGGAVCDAGAYEFVPFPSVTFVQAASRVSENPPARETDAILMVLSDAYVEEVTVAWSVTGGTATEGGDYTRGAGTVTFAAGSTLNGFSIGTVNDFANEPAETVIVTLSNPSRASIQSPSTHTRTIVNDDPPHLCDGSAATITGTPGDDIIRGTPDADVIHGLGGDDRILGLGGDDVLCGAAGEDFLVGGAGDDRQFGGLGDDRLNGVAGEDALFGQIGADMMNGQGADDELVGGGGDDTLRGQAGADSLNGGAGSDTVRGGFGADAVNGGPGDDALAGSQGSPDACAGGLGSDSLLPLDGCESVTGVP